MNEHLINQIGIVIEALQNISENNLKRLEVEDLLITLVLKLKTQEGEQ